MASDERAKVTAPTDADALRLCLVAGHCPDGRLTAGDRAIGRCARCGVGLLTDGSEAK